jgi:hypothetical protein
MENNDKIKPEDEQVPQAEDDIGITPGAGALIAGNLAGINAGLSTTATGAPAASALDEKTTSEATGAEEEEETP